MRTQLKSALAKAPGITQPSGATLLIYHRVGGGSGEELDTTKASFTRQMELLANREVLSLDHALDRLDTGNRQPSYVITFDDGFEDVYHNAWPVLRALDLPFTIYLAAAYVARPMRWEGATAKGAPGVGLSWAHLAEMVGSGLCTVGNHTHHHVPPTELTARELDLCTEAIQENLGVTPDHFTYPWGIPVPAIEPALRSRFRSASTGEIGRNAGLTDRMRLRRVPVRRTDPDSFFAAKLVGNLGPERAYAGIVRMAKAAGVSS